MRKLIVGMIFITGLAFGQWGAISGSVTNGTNDEPLRYTLIIAENLNHPMHSMISYTRRSGQYTIRHLEPGAYFVKAIHPGFRSLYYNNDTSRSEADTVYVTAGATTSGIDFTLYPWNHYISGAVVSGTVTDEATGTPLRHSFVFLRPVDSTRHHMFHRLFSFTDSTGAYQITGVPAGHYIAVSYKIGYEREYYDNASSRDSAEVLVINDSDTLNDINFTLRRITFATITGTVTDESTSMAIPRAKVMAVRLVHGRPIGWRRLARTDSTGFYHIRKLIPGNYIVKAWKFGYEREFYNNASVIDSATPVHVEWGDTISGIDFTLTPWSQFPYDTASITGTVTDESTGDPIAGAHVRAFFRRWPFSIVTTTDSNGSYTLHYLPSGDSVVVMARARGYLYEFYQETPYIWDATPVVPPASNIDFTLTPRGNYGSGGIMGEVSNGKSDGLTILATNLSTGESFVGAIDMNSYNIDDMPPGDYDVKVLDVNGNTLAEDTVTVGDTYVEKDFHVTEVGESSSLANPVNLQVKFANLNSVKLEFALPKSERVELKLYDVTGRVVSSRNLGLLGAGAHEFEVKGLRPGVYFVSVEAGNKISTGKFVILR